MLKANAGHAADKLQDFGRNHAEVFEGRLGKVDEVDKLNCIRVFRPILQPKSAARSMGGKFGLKPEVLVNGESTDSRNFGKLKERD